MSVPDVPRPGSPADPAIVAPASWGRDLPDGRSPRIRSAPCWSAVPLSLQPRCLAATRGARRSRVRMSSPTARRPPSATPSGRSVRRHGTTERTRRGECARAPPTALKWPPRRSRDRRRALSWIEIGGLAARIARARRAITRRAAGFARRCRDPTRPTRPRRSRRRAAGRRTRRSTRSRRRRARRRDRAGRRARRWWAGVYPRARRRAAPAWSLVRARSRSSGEHPRVARAFGQPAVGKTGASTSSNSGAGLRSSISRSRRRAWNTVVR